MDKDTKQALKEARELLKQKDYKEARKKCQKILKGDKNNYVALVLLGAAMQEIEDVRVQAPLALKKAAEIQPSNPLAWQGLAAFYEKERNDASTWMELLPIYSTLLRLETESSKFLHFLNRISSLSVRLHHDAVLTAVVSSLSSLRNTVDEDRTKLINDALATILTQHPDLPMKDDNTLESALAALVKDPKAKNRHDYYRKYLKALYKSNKLTTLIEEAVQMHELFSEDPYPLKLICEVYSEQSVLNENWDGIDVTKFYTALLDLDERSSTALMAKAVNLYYTGSLIEARAILNQTVTLKSQWLHAWVILAEVNVKLYCWEEAEYAASEAMKFINSDLQGRLRYRMDLVLIEALAKSEIKDKWVLAVEKCKDLLTKHSSTKILLAQARAHIRLRDQQASALLDQLENNPETRVEATILKAIDLMSRNNLEEAADVLGSTLETSEAWLALGKIHWLLSDYAHSLMAFLKGIHTDPYNWECLVYLGHYYREHGNDLDRSRKCYQKALQINSNSEQAGVGLSTAYRLQKNSEANMQLLQRITAPGGGPKWAWLQLGLQYLDQGDMLQAITALRTVIRSDPNDNHCWECLADAYWSRGAYMSALKSYQRALDLSPESLYPMIQLANIKLMLGQYTEAKEDFKHVLRQEHCYIPALKGLAETYLGIAIDCAKKQLLGRARDHIQQAVYHLTKVITERGDLSCIWKLLGDACYRMVTLPDKYNVLNVAPGLVKSDEQAEYVNIGRKEISLLCSRCYCRALSLSQDSPFLWHDLACCYLAQLHFDLGIDKRQETVSRALAAAKQAVKLCPSTWSHWNVLGVVCMLKEIKNYALAQHCFIVAIDIESNNAIAWTNLGTLYLNLGDVSRANKAFSRAQRADPAYVNSWIGQASIAERMSRKEAMDLFRHSTQLCYHGQAAIGYAHWVMTTLLDPHAKKDPLYAYTIENMHAVPVATDAMTWYIEHNPNDPCALNVYGLLLERQKLYKSAARVLSQALEITSKDTEWDAVSVNLARVKLHLGERDEAVNLCNAVKNPSLNSHCQLALSLFKAKLYEKSYNAYKEALHWLADASSDKAHILCAMAAIAYMFQEVDDVKTLLFQCIQIQPPIVSGLLAAAALGVLHGDAHLATLVLRELQPYRDHPEHRIHVTVLLAYSHLIQNDVAGAIRVFSKAAHRHPGDVGSWIGLVRLLLAIDARSFSNCAQKALFLGRNCSSLSVAQVACISSLSQLIAGRTRNNGIRSVQKTIYSFPTIAESWANLIVALLPRVTEPESVLNARWLCTLISIVRRGLRASKPLEQWLMDNEKKALLIACDIASVS